MIFSNNEIEIPLSRFGSKLATFVPAILWIAVSISLPDSIVPPNLT